MNETALYGLVLVVAFGFFWRWIDRIDKKIDKIFDILDDIKDTHVKSEEFNKLADKVARMEEKQLKCKSCNSN